MQGLTPPDLFYYIAISVIDVIPVLVRLDDSLAKELDRVAKSLGVSKAELVRIALRHFLRKVLRQDRLGESSSPG